MVAQPIPSKLGYGGFLVTSSKHSYHVLSGVISRDDGLARSDEDEQIERLLIQWSPVPVNVRH